VVAAATATHSSSVPVFLQKVKSLPNIHCGIMR
jgi:hypothetical protein